MPLKSEIRKIAKEYRNNILNKNELDLKICNDFLNCDFYKDADEVFLYSPVHNEIDTATILDDALSKGKKVAFPKCLDCDGTMQFYYINSKDDLKIGFFGVLEPKQTTVATPSESSVIVVPALSFDSFGMRVGYGKGYYDRYLKNRVAVCVGLCYNDLVFNIEDKNEFDISVDFLVTESSIRKF